ncbi:hypothetical protein CMI40_01990 [Candidatus Pacearchaeota archaeon]|jgi:hypothetical protein|nr:hypothetical protein [Candidatus Pacearchaeota archaeon]|tara:strand:+ start:15912 stop:16151 length:240 start_codon:yes stop_codon:yes gene_type:complete
MDYTIYEIEYSTEDLVAEIAIVSAENEKDAESILEKSLKTIKKNMNFDPYNKKDLGFKSNKKGLINNSFDHSYHYKDPQ